MIVLLRGLTWTQQGRSSTVSARQDLRESAPAAGPRTISRRRDRLDHDEAVIAGFAAPGFARPAIELAHVRARFVARECVELFRHGIEAQNRVGAEIGEPDLVLVVDIDGI